MKPVRSVIALLIANLLFLSGSIRAFADEGLWPFNHIPRDRIKKTYGVSLSDEWLLRAQRGTVSFDNGSSGSFVSADGIVLTNQHVALDYADQVATPEKNYVKQGFYARNRSDELKIPKIEVRALDSIQDVTERVKKAAAPGVPSGQAEEARRREISAIQQESEKATGLVSEVVVPYQGVEYNLYRYRRYTDVRVVFLPESGIATFGGDEDNFNYPRYWLDVAMFRVYEGGKPIKSPDYFKASRTGVKAADPVFVPGYPISTQRFLTAAHLEFVRDTELPLVIKQLKRKRDLLRTFAAQGEVQSQKVQSQLFDVENTLKALEGRLAGLANRALVKQKREFESRLIQAMAEDPTARRDYEDALEAVERGRKALSAYDAERRFLDEGWAFDTRLFRAAREHVRLAQQRSKPPAQRMPGFDDDLLNRLEKDIGSWAPEKSAFDQMKLADSLEFMRDALGPSHPAVAAVLSGKTPSQRATEIFAGTHLDDPAFRKALASGGLPALLESTDPMIVLIRWVDPRALELRSRYQSEVLSVENNAYVKIARILREVMGNDLHPDAAFNLRLSYGAVRGYKEATAELAPFTDLDGLYRRAAEQQNKPPFQLSDVWLSKKAALDLKTPFNFVSTNDVVGGTSGSPVLNREGEIVGVIFDGNIHSLVGKFLYDDRQNRAIAVDLRGIREALRVVYGANELIDELGWR